MEKFYGCASEHGNALITLCESAEDNHDYSWMYIVSDKIFKSRIDVKRCYFCDSKKIIKT
jgi:hypothetical protein